MPVVKIEPSSEHKVPYNLDDDTPGTLLEEIEVAGNTAELQVGMGAPLELPNGQDQRSLQALINNVAKNKAEAGTALSRTSTAYAAASFLRNYGQQLAFDAAQARSAITAKLMEIADCGDIKYELKALELLGKHSDIGLFTERSEITINYKNPEDLENAIKDRVKRLLNAEIIDVTPVGLDLDEELGVFDGPIENDLTAELEDMYGETVEEEGQSNED